MQGQTTANVVGEKRCTDPHTLLLLTDDIVDRSMYCNAIISHNVKSTTTRQRDGRNSLAFIEGMTSYLSLFKNFLIGTNSFTIEYWIYFIKGISGGATYHQPQSHNSNWQGIILGYSDGNVLYFGNNDSWNVFSSIKVFSITASTWAHCALVRDGASWRAYTNGVLTWSATASASFPAESAYETWIGHYHSSGYFIGNLQDYRISDIARYTSNFTPPERFL